MRDDYCLITITAMRVPRFHKRSAKAMVREQKGISSVGGTCHGGRLHGLG